MVNSSVTPVSSMETRRAVSSRAARISSWLCCGRLETMTSWVGRLTPRSVVRPTNGPGDAGGLPQGRGGSIFCGGGGSPASKHSFTASRARTHASGDRTFWISKTVVADRLALDRAGSRTSTTSSRDWSRADEDLWSSHPARGMAPRIKEAIQDEGAAPSASKASAVFCRAVPTDLHPARPAKRAGIPRRGTRRRRRAELCLFPAVTERLIER